MNTEYRIYWNPRTDPEYFTPILPEYSPIEPRTDGRVNIRYPFADSEPIVCRTIPEWYCSTDVWSDSTRVFGYIPEQIPNDLQILLTVAKQHGIRPR